MADRLTTIVIDIRNNTYTKDSYFKNEEDWIRAQDWVDLLRDEFYIKYPDAKPKDKEDV